MLIIFVCLFVHLFSYCICMLIIFVYLFISFLIVYICGHCSFQMSNITKKLYTNMNKAVPFEIHMRKMPRGEYFIRATAVFSSAQFLRTNVTRCPNHASVSEITNHGEYILCIFILFFSLFLIII